MPLLWRQVSNLPGQKRASWKLAATNQPGLDPAMFGKHPNGSRIDAASLCVKAPSVVAIRLPADLFAGTEFVATGMLHEPTGKEGSVQLQVHTSRPDATAGNHSAKVVRDRWGRVHVTWLDDLAGGECRAADYPLDMTSERVLVPKPVLDGRDTTARKRMRGRCDGRLRVHGLRCDDPEVALG